MVGRGQNDIKKLNGIEEVYDKLLIHKLTKALADDLCPIQQEFDVYTEVV